MNKDTSDTCIPALRKPKCMASAEKSKEMPYLSMIANGKPNEVLEVLDPKNMEFSCLVELLHPKFICEYLELILNFLTQSINEVRFPDIAPYKAAFLERIVTNPSNLRSDCFNESSKIVISEIISVLETKKNIFKWTFEYENSKPAKSVLIYRKQPLPQPSPLQKLRRYFAEIHDNYFNKVTLLIPRLVLALVILDFRASLVQVQVAELARESSQSLPITDEIPLSFKKLWIGNTLQFTKDDSRLTLVYPQMPRHYKDFISSMIWDPTKDVKMDPKNLCSPVWEAMRIFWLKYEFWLSSQNIGSDKVEMILEKRPKNAAVKKNDKPETIEKSESQTALFLKPADRLIAVGSPQLLKEEIKSPPVQRRQPTRLKKIELQVIKQLQSLSEQFFNRVFKELTDFLEDHLLASLVFSSVTQSEANFLIRLNSVLKNSYNLDLFPSEHRMTLKKIHSTLAKKSYMTIDVKLEKLQKKTKLRDVKFLKVLKPGPVRTLGPPKQLPLESSDNGMQALGKSTKSPQSTLLVKEKSNPFLRALSVSSEELNSVKSDRLPNNKQSSENRDPSPESQPSRPTSVTKSVTKSKILLDLTDQSVHSGQSSNRSSSRDGLSKAKQKMLEALSVPVQSDKAERMMMLMGWQGGALGVRGEGITEPILPALQIKAGAGLGHVAPLKPTKQAKSDPAKVTPEFRMCFMSDLLQLIRAEKEDMTVDYDDSLTDKERYFITSIIKSCNRRREFGLGARDEIEMVRTITEALLGTPISLNVAISKDRRSVTFAKHMKYELIAKQLKNKKAKKKAELPDPEQKEKDFKIKMELLKRTLSFVKSDCKRFVINIKEKHPVPSFYTAFFESVVAIANKNVPIVYRNMVDYELYKELVEAVSGFCLELNCEENGEQKFIISKRHRKRFINSALEGTAQKVGKEDCNNDETATLEFAIDNDDTDEGTSLSEDKSCQSNYNSDKIDVKKDTQKVDIDRDHDKTDTEKDFDDFEETSKKDLKLEIYEDDWLNCCDSDTTKDLKNDCDKETNNNYVVKSNDYLTKPKRNGNTASMSTIEDVDFKTVHIMPNDYPNVKVDTELGIRIQNDLLEKLKMEVSLPKLRCLGIQNDALVYSCRNENTYLFLTDFVEQSELNLQLVEFPPVTPLTYTVEFKINSLLQTDVSDTFVNFELYNNGLETDKWALLEAQSKENCVFMKVNVDVDSYKYICDRRFSLDLGFDTAIFRLVW